MSNLIWISYLYLYWCCKAIWDRKMWKKKHKIKYNNFNAAKSRVVIVMLIQ